MPQGFVHVQHFVIIQKQVTSFQVEREHLEHLHCIPGHRREESFNLASELWETARFQRDMERVSVLTLLHNCGGNGRVQALYPRDIYRFEVINSEKLLRSTQGTVGIKKKWSIHSPQVQYENRDAPKVIYPE